MKFIAYYLNLEWKLINRKLIKVGFNLTVFWIVVPALSSLIALNLVQKDSISAWVLLGGFSLLFQVPPSKIHHDFLNTNLGNLNISAIRITRNLLISIPLIVLFLVFNKWPQILALFVLAFLFSWIKTPQLKLFALPTPYRKYPFEFIIGFRRYFWIWTILIPMIYVSKIYQNDALAIFAFVVILLVQLQFFNIQEPTWYIWNEAKTPSEFLYFKIRIGLICSLISNTIPAILLSVILPESAIIIASLWALSLVLCPFAIVCKYAFIPSQLPALQGFLFAFNIIFPPFLLFSIPYLFKKAELNLKNFLV
jgi:hypothetical protein